MSGCMKKSANSENKLFRILSNETFTSNFISWVAGDVIQDKEESLLYNETLRQAGSDLYVKLLFFITHEVFEKEKAKWLWKGILLHKQEISEKLGRNVEITVATLDYLTNIRKEISNPKLIGEAFIGKIAELSSVDPLTKMYNRQHMFLKLEEEIIRYKRYGAGFSILMIDIDDFKRINDSYGHPEGDNVLVTISGLINKSIRDLDLSFRYGGEEFLVILPHTEMQLAVTMAERLRENISDHYLASLKVTISTGLSNCPKSAIEAEALLQKADDALYISKTNGKNMVSVL